jgi:hypothetical protein
MRAYPGFPLLARPERALGDRDQIEGFSRARARRLRRLCRSSCGRPELPNPLSAAQAAALTAIAAAPQASPPPTP